MSKLNMLSALLLRSPLLWGGALSFLFFALVHGGVVSDPLVVRYLAGHWVEYVEVAMFGVGLAALGLRAAEVVAQRRGLAAAPLGPIPNGGQDPAAASELVAALPASGGYLSRRIRESLDYVVRTGSADGLEDHLKYLADMEAARASQGYGLVRFVVWAIPIMGFLGTVIGITVAIASLSPTQLENISGVVAGLGTAFDTTATALALSMVLMFGQFVLERFEQSVLEKVDEAAWGALAGRFQSVGGDGSALAVARLGETVGRGAARLLEAQERSWRELERTTHAGLEQLLAQGGETLRGSLATALESGLTRWGEALARTYDEAAGRREERWAEAAEALAAAVHGLERHQEALSRQAELLGSVSSAARDVAALERSLDANLATLAASGRFEETLETLSAAVHLLSARAAGQRRDEIDQVRRVGKAA